MIRYNLEKMKSKDEALSFLIQKGVAKDKKEAEKCLFANIPKESYYQKKIMDYLKYTYPTAFIWKAAAGAYSRRGIPDVCAIIDGRYFGFEVKRPLVGVVSVIQEKTIEKIRASGCCAGVVTFPEDVEKIISGALNETDQTKKYAGMIESFECDFNLAADPDQTFSLDSLQEKIDGGDNRLADDIELLRELSYKIRNGTAKIVEYINQ